MAGDVDAGRGIHGLVYAAEGCGSQAGDSFDRVSGLLQTWRMRVVILCGGQGTRIRDVSENIPKPMLPIGGRPIVWHIMKSYASHGFNEFVLCLGYKGWLIKEFFLNYRTMMTDCTVRLGSPDDVITHNAHGESDWTVTLADTGEETMTGGRVAAIKRYVEKDDVFMLTYGDGVSDVNIKELVAFHKSHGKIATVTGVRPPGRFGEMSMDGSRVIEFNEKPQANSGFINGGFFVVDAKRIWPYIAGPKIVFEQEPLKKLAGEGELVAYEHRGFWQPMDTFREYSLLNDLWSRGTAPWKTW